MALSEYGYSPETEALQRELVEKGYLPALKSNGESSVDGWFGPKTRAAQMRRDEDLARMPLPPVPWWRTRRMKGMVLAVAGLAGFFVPALKEVDTAEMVNMVWENLDHVEQIITSVSALIALVGALWSQIGAAKATAPVDTTLVAKVRGRELRLPGRRGVPSMPSDDPKAKPNPSPYWTGDRKERGPFFSDL